MRRGFHSNRHSKGPRSQVFRARIWGGGQCAEAVPRSPMLQPVCCWGASFAPPVVPGMAPHLIKSHLASPPLVTHRGFCRVPGEDLSSSGVATGCSAPSRSPVLPARPCLPSGAGERGQALVGCAGSPPPLLPPQLFLAAYPAGQVLVAPPLLVGTVILGKRRRQRSCQGCGSAFGPGTALLWVGKLCCCRWHWGYFTHSMLQC